MAEKISVQIALEGGDEVEKQLAAIGKTGEGAFDQISKAADDVGLEKVGESAATAAEGITKAGEASQTTGGEFARLIEAADRLTEATNKATEAHSKFSLETVKTSLAIVEYSGKIALTGVEIVQAVRHHDTLIQSLLKVVSAVNTSVRAFALLSPELAGFATGVGTVAVTIGGAALAFEVLRKAAEATAGPLAKLSQDLTTLSANTGEMFDNLQRGRAAFEQLGISGENFAGIITKINEAMSSFDVGAKVDESFKKLLEAEKALLEEQLRLNSVAVIGMEEPIAIRQRLLEVTKQLEVATSGEAKVEELAAAKAKVLANNLADIIPLVQKIADGQKGLTFDGLTTAATKIDAVTAAMKKAGDSGKTAGQVLVDFIASADRLSAIQVGKQFGVTEEQIDRIRRLGGALSIDDEIWQGLQSRGVLISPESAAAVEKLQVSLDQAAQAKVRFNQAMASSIPTTFAAQTGSALEDLKTKFVNLATTDIEGLNRALATLGTTSGLANTISELEAVGRLLTLIGGQATGFSWGEIVATGGLASTRQELEAIGAVIVRAWEAAKNFTWGALWDSSGLANTRRELEAIGSVLDGLIQKLVRFFTVKGEGGGQQAPALAGGPGFAGGGLLGGRGTGTSDSNLAWVSRGEYVTPARAVSQPGVLAFLEALRRSGGNLSRVLDGMGQFALGGMIRGPMPAFASGGLAGGMSNVTIQFPGLPAIGGLRASSDVVDQLHRAAALAQVRSGGRKPSRYS